MRYDRDGDQHYDVVSAFIKSVRGSDVDAALHYLARMLEGGEDPRFIARRLEEAGIKDIVIRPLGVEIDTFRPDQIVIATEPPEQSIWHRFDVVDRARSDYHIPVTNVIALAPTEEPVA